MLQAYTGITAGGGVGPVCLWCIWTVSEDSSMFKTNQAKKEKTGAGSMVAGDNRFFWWLILV